jgi:hypothetical protein
VEYTSSITIYATWPPKYRFGQQESGMRPDEDGVGIVTGWTPRTSTSSRIAFVVEAVASTTGYISECR